MKLTQPVLLLFFVYVSHTNIINDVKDNVLSFIQRSIASYKNVVDDPENKLLRRELNHFQDRVSKADAKRAHEKAQLMKMANKPKVKPANPMKNLDWHLPGKYEGIERYRMDPVLNYLSRRQLKRPKKPPAVDGESSEGDTSSSRELQDWKDEFREEWLQKKFEAINSSQPTGDTVNMLAARPWGIPCGDPNQHDMPWGSCMLPMECEAEYRIYRGDYFCGRTQFICCALQLTTYDMYQGFDVSFADSELQTDSEELRQRKEGSKERRRKKKLKEKRRRKRVRIKRKRQIKRNIRKIIKEIKKILNRSYRNGTTARKRKTKQLKKFVKDLKTQFKKDRKAVKNIHELELIKIDQRLQDKLNQIKGMNQQFIGNRTYRDIIVNGTVNQKVVRMLVEVYPELSEMLDASRRRSNQIEPKKNPDYLDYDIEYGLLYY